MSLWVDKYRPKCLEDLQFHKEIGEMITKMVVDGDFPHLLFYGPTGAGKHTMIQALLRKVFGKGAHRTKTEHRSFKATKSKTIDLTTVGSSYHIEMTPQDAGIYDRIVVQEVIKEIASSHTISTGSAPCFKVVVLKEVDRLTRSAQHGLRRTMEKYMATCRLLLCCENASKVIDPLRSRCLAIRIPAPKHDEILNMLNYVAKQEGVRVDVELAKKICLQSDRNMRHALLMMEACYVDNKQMSKDQDVKMAAWQIFIEEIAKLAIEEQTPTRIMMIRSKLYELLVKCIPPEMIMQQLAEALMKRLDDSLRFEIAEWAAFHEHRMNQGSKKVVHIEAFLARFMQLYRIGSLHIVSPNPLAEPAVAGEDLRRGWLEPAQLRQIC